MSTWSVISGTRKSDKAECASKVAAALARRGYCVGGFVQRQSAESGGWDLERIGSGERFSLAKESANPTLCSYEFAPEGFRAAAEWARAPGCQAVVIGGIGKLESARQGHWPLLEELVRDPLAPHVIACVRDTSLATVALSLPDPGSYLELPCEEEQVAAFVDELERLVRGITSPD